MNLLARSVIVTPVVSLYLTGAAFTFAQNPAAPAPQAETKPVPAPPTPAGSEKPAPSALSKFSTEEAMQSYALGMYFGPNNRSYFQDHALDVDSLKRGLSDVFKNERDFSYAVGASIALQIAYRNPDIDIDQLLSGLVDTFEYKETKLSREEQREAMTSLEASLKEKREQEIAAGAAANEAKGKAFLEENAEREGVVTTASGLQYEVIKEGSGEKKPGDEDTVALNYTGSLLSGKVFDQTDAGSPKRLSLKSRYIIPGWKEGLMLMSPGAKYKFFIPHSLAYGMEPRNSAIGGNETLIMESELLSVEPPRAAPAPAPLPTQGASAVTPPVRVPLKDGATGKATAVTPPVKVEFPKPGEKDAQRGVRVTPPVKVEFPKKEEGEAKTDSKPEVKADDKK